MIPCHLGCINRVDLSLHFFFLEFCVDFGDFFFFEVILGGDGWLYLWVVVASCACVWWWVCYNFVLVFVYGGRFLFCIFFILMVFLKYFYILF